MLFEPEANPIPWVANMTKPDWDTFFMGLAFYYCTRSPDKQTKTGCVIVDWPSKLPIGMGYNGGPRGVDGLPWMREGSVLHDPVSITTDSYAGPKVYRQGEVVPKEVRHLVNPSLLQQLPDKYPTVIHADLNAITNLRCPSNYAVGYLPFEPCENCFLAWLSRADVKFRRIVILSSRPMPNFTRLLEMWNKAHDRDLQIMVDVMGPQVRGLRESTLQHGPAPAWDPAAALYQAAKYTDLMIAQSAELSKDSAKLYR